MHVRHLTLGEIRTLIQALLVFAAGFLTPYLGLLLWRTLVALLSLQPAPYPHAPILFEDGSFILWTITGCLPGWPCQ